jgi:hypothetical protein
MAAVLTGDFGAQPRGQTGRPRGRSHVHEPTLPVHEQEPLQARTPGRDVGIRKAHENGT